MPVVKVIPQKINPITKQSIATTKKKRVAAYARVSTDSDEQYTSYEAQRDFYTNYIKAREDWTYVETYADEGRSGTSTKSRDGFNAMIERASFDFSIISAHFRIISSTISSSSLMHVFLHFAANQMLCCIISLRRSNLSFPDLNPQALIIISKYLSLWK